MLANLPRWVWVLAVGGLLILPSLGTYGLWDPAEIREADVAREVAEKGFADVAGEGRYSQRPVLGVWLVAIGFKVFGVNEFAGRFPLALCGLLTLLLAYRVCRRLVSEDAALISAFVLATTPTFLFQSRQLVGEVPYYMSLIAAAGGLAAYLWPADGRRSRLDLLLGGVGLVLGFLARGLLLGALLPVISLGIAVILARRSTHRATTARTFLACQQRRAVGGGTPSAGDEVWPAMAGPDLNPGQTVASALRAAALPLAATVGGAALVIGLLVAVLPNGEFLLLGGELQKVSIPPQFHLVFRDLGFGFYPWFALLPVALLSFVWIARPAPTAHDPAAAAGEATGAGADRRGEVAGAATDVGPGRDALVKLLVVVLAIGGYVAAAVWAGHLGKIRFPALPWLAIAVGLLLFETWRGGVQHRLWGLVAAALILVLQQDFVVAPESLAFSHLLQSAKYPADLDIKLAMRLFGAGLAILLFLVLGGGPRPFAPPSLVERVASKRRERMGARWLLFGPALGGAHVIDQLSWVVARAAEGLCWLGGRRGHHYWLAAGVLALAFAGWCAHYLTPQLSRHLSNKALFGTYHRCKAPGERLAQYLVTGRGAAYYNDGQVDPIRSQAELFQLFRKSERAFVLVPASHLGAIDQAARSAKVPYHVLDDTNSQYLILSNKLAGPCDTDRNPLRELVLRTPPTPRKRVLANFENRVQLLGYDVDDVVSRGGKFKITLYFKVLSRMPANYKIFIHFDQPAHRFHGDHQPLGGKYPTQYWLPGDYIVDPHEVEIPMLTTPTGRYTIMTGFWLGAQRLKVVDGPSDNRVRLGTIRVAAF